MIYMAAMKLQEFFFLRNCARKKPPLYCRLTFDLAISVFLDSYCRTDKNFKEQTRYSDVAS